MKILHVIDSGGLYGAENVVLSLMRQHREQGIDVELASISEPGEGRKAIEDEATRFNLRWNRFELEVGLDVSGITRIVGHARDGGVVGDSFHIRTSPTSSCHCLKEAIGKFQS